MKILLAYHFQGNFSLMGLEPLGLMQLGRLLKDDGHQVRYAPLERRALSRALREFSPGMIGYSISSVDYARAGELNREIKRALPAIVSVFGGPHPTFFPEMIADAGVDAICVGEGDHAFTAFARALEERGDFTRVPNFRVKTDSGEVVVNELAPLVEDLDTFPFIDRDGFYQDNPWAGSYPVKSGIASRGCPFSCTYCFNDSFRRLYRGKGKTWRHRSPGHLVAEFEELKRRYRVRQLCFVDDLFIASRDWLAEFSERYRDRVGLPFVCMVRLDRIDDEQAGLLARAGCEVVLAAIESGVEPIRREVLGRRMTNEQIIAGADALHRHGIKFFSQNMLGVPGENREMIMQTLDLNLRIRADLAITSLFAPFPDLPLTRRAVAEGYYSGRVEDLPPNMTTRSALRLPEKEKIERLQKLFPLLVALPALRPAADLLVRLPLHPLYQAVRKLVMGVKFMQTLRFHFSARDALGAVSRMFKFVVFDR